MAEVNQALVDANLAKFEARVKAHGQNSPEGISAMAAATTTPWACYWIKTELFAEGIALVALAAAGLSVAGIAAGIGTGVVAVANLLGYTMTVEEFTTTFVNEMGGTSISLNPYDAAGQLTNVICVACGADAPCNPDGSGG